MAMYGCSNSSQGTWSQCLSFLCFNLGVKFRKILFSSFLSIVFKSTLIALFSHILSLSLYFLLEPFVLFRLVALDLNLNSDYMLRRRNSEFPLSQKLRENCSR